MKDMTKFMERTVPILEEISRQITDIAKQIENNFDTLTGIVAELTETCTVGEWTGSDEPERTECYRASQHQKQ